MTSWASPHDGSVTSLNALRDWGYGQNMKLGPGLTFSWKRALGITSAKRKISRATGIPLTRSGRQRKLGKWLGMR